MSRLDSRLRKLESGHTPSMAPWVQLIQREGESSNEFEARISAKEREGVNVLANFIVDPPRREDVDGQAIH